MGLNCSSNRESIFLGHFVVTELLGEGLHAKVFLAKDCRNKKKLAIKFFSNENEDGGFSNEVHALNILKHKNIIYMEEFGKIMYCGKEQQYILLEHAENHDLFEYVSITGGFEENDAKILFQEILEAVEYIHGQGT
jgi:serine/threonine protein kinase